MSARSTQRSVGVLFTAVAATALLTACSAGGGSMLAQPQPASPSSSPASVAHFVTLPPGSTLPSDSTCAAEVKTRPENKGMNASFNSTLGGQGLPGSFFPSADDPRAASSIAPRVSGDFTGTTDEILQWAACKWGIDEDIVRSQAAIESWWHQTALGDFGTDPAQCPPGHGLGVDGTPGECPQSYGILQNRWPYEQASWPGIARSTAFNADTAYAIWRACFEGYESWLNDVPHGQPYAAGDAWGCVGRWFAGRWHTTAADGYVSNVQSSLAQRIWEQPNFQEP